MANISEENISRILVVEDDENLRLSLVDNLELEGYCVDSASSLNSAKKKIDDETEAELKAALEEFKTVFSAN